MGGEEEGVGKVGRGCEGERGGGDGGRKNRGVGRR